MESERDNLLDYVLMKQDHDNLKLNEVIVREFSLFMISHDGEEPRTIQQALLSPKAKEWFEVMEEEII